MANDARQNPSNRWARNSGAGAGGVSQIVPTEAEARRGLEPLAIDVTPFRARNVALGLTAICGALFAGSLIRRARQPRTLPDRMMRRVGMR